MEDISIKLSSLYKTRKFAVFCIVLFWLSILYLLYLYSNSFTFIREKEFVFAVITTSVIIVWGPIQLLYRFFDKQIKALIQSVFLDHDFAYETKKNDSIASLYPKDLFNRNVHGVLFEGNIVSVDSRYYNISVREVVEGFSSSRSSLFNFGIGNKYYYGSRITDHYLLWEFVNKGVYFEPDKENIESKYVFHGKINKVKEAEEKSKLFLSFLAYFFLISMLLIGVISLLKYFFAMDNQILLFIFIGSASCAMVVLANKLIKNPDKKVNKERTINDLINEYHGGEAYRFLLEKLGTNIQITKHANSVYIKQQLLNKKLFYIGAWFTPSLLLQDINRYISLIAWMKKNIDQLYKELE